MIRITGGQFKGRALIVPAHTQTRPTLSKLRQAWYNALQGWIEDARILDLFSGSGTLGFEALSRGAAHVTFVEKHGPTAQMIHKNAVALGTEDRIEVIQQSFERAEEVLLQGAPYDIVLADPPYGMGWEKKLVEQVDWSRWLAPEGRLCLESGGGKKREHLPESTPFLVKIREKNYGDSWLTFYEKLSTDPRQGDVSRIV